MGDEELNFTEEEARCWADDPRNQEQDTCFVRVVAVFILVLAALIAGIVATSVRPGGDRDPVYLGVLLAP